jgi:hypothetical protein
MVKIKSIKDWLTARNRKDKKLIPKKDGSLREFIYLDEVSLTSLYASKLGEIKDHISEDISRAEQAELAAEFSAAAVMGKASINPRFQTSNARSMQTTRKAVIQSLFAEFRNFDQKVHFSDSGTISPENQLPENRIEFNSISEISSNADGKYALLAKQLKRGDLIEIKVELAVDEIFKISTLVSEFLEMAKSTPELVEMAGVEQQLQDVKPAHSFFQHLLSGLIPLRSRAIDYCVVRSESEEYIVRKDAVTNFHGEIFPLEVVGVTEHLSYWKDIRRVLFSSSEFTMLCRVSRTGIHQSWTPVKMVDLLDLVTPIFREQVDSFKNISFDSTALPQSLDHGDLAKALTFFYREYVTHIKGTTSESEQDVLEFISGQIIKVDAKSIIGQNEAFRNLEEYLDGAMKTSMTPVEILELRKEARLHGGLKVLADSAQNNTVIVQNNNDTSKNRIIDTEIIAIYW